VRKRGGFEGARGLGWLSCGDDRRLELNPTFTFPPFQVSQAQPRRNEKLMGQEDKHNRTSRLGAGELGR
jgi:hypothetical protein